MKSRKTIFLRLFTFNVSGMLYISSMDKERQAMPFEVQVTSIKNGEWALQVIAETPEDALQQILELYPSTDLGMIRIEGNDQIISFNKFLINSRGSAA